MRNIFVSLHDPFGRKICELYDSQCMLDGQIANLKITHRDGDLSTMTFDVPTRLAFGSSDNFRCQYMVNEFLVYYNDNHDTDVFVITDTQEVSRGDALFESVECIHLSKQLKKRGYMVSFTDMTATAGEMIDAVLKGTGWTKGTVDAFNEENLFDKRISCSASSGLYDTPSDAGANSYIQIHDMRGKSQWNSTAGWLNASWRIETHSKNVCDGIIEKGGLVTATGLPDYTETDLTYRSIDYMDGRPFAGSKLIVSGTGVGGARWFFFNAEKEMIGTPHSGQGSGTVPSNTAYIKYELWANSAHSSTFASPPVHVQIEVGQTVTSYEAYCPPYVIETGSIGQYDVVSGRYINRKTKYNDATHTVSESATATQEPIPVYSARLFENGTIYVENTGIGTSGVVLSYTVESPDGAYPREKIRTMSKEANTGAYSALQEIANTFDGKLKFNGYSKTVSLVKEIGDDNGVGFNIQYNMNSITRQKTSTDIVTRLFCGIDDMSIASVNPNGLPYLMNFRYYDESGVLTDEQREAITDFEDVASANAGALTDLYDLRSSISIGINTLVGQTPLGIAAATVTAANEIVLSDTLYYSGGTAPKAKDVIWIKLSDGTWSKYGVTSYSAGLNKVIIDGEPQTCEMALWYAGALPGTIGARLVTLSAVADSIEFARKEYESADESEEDELREIWQAAVDRRRELSNGTPTSAGLNQMIATLYEKVSKYNATEEQINLVNTDMEQATEQFENIMDGLIHDGSYTEGDYIAGQESALYNDMSTWLKDNCVPQTEYSVSAVDRGYIDGYDLDKIKYGDIVYITDPKLNIYNLKASVCEYIDEPQSEAPNQFNIGNFQKPSEDLFQEIVDGARIIKAEKKTIDNSVQLDENGLISADIVEKSIQASGAGKLIDLKGNASIAEQDVNENQTFKNAVSSIVLECLTTALMNASEIDWSNVGAIIAKINEISVQAASEAVDPVSGAVSELQTTVTQQAGQIAAKAEQTEVDGLTQRVSSAETKITPEAIYATVREENDNEQEEDRFSTIGVMRDEINLGVGSIRIGARNFFKNSEDLDWDEYAENVTAIVGTAIVGVSVIGSD